MRQQSTWTTRPRRTSTAFTHEPRRTATAVAVQSRPQVSVGKVVMLNSQPSASSASSASFVPARERAAVPVARVARPSVVIAPPPEEMNAWLSAARNFDMNTDFDVAPLLADRRRSIQEVVDVMKVNSGGKGTIQALGDKIVLSKLLENLGIPQMPVLFSTYSKVEQQEVDSLVASWKTEEDFDVVIKPTHLSSAAGAIFMCKSKWEKDGWNAQKLKEHMETYLQKKASESESEALKSLVPGFVVQPRYRSSVGFNFPLELRVVTLWGKARVGIWWWGRHSDPKGRRSTWFVRKPAKAGELSENDDWEVIHEHRGGNRGFEVSLKLFKEAMPVMCTAAEAIATAVGAPFLRSDFFVGDSRWGVRLNEVAYGSGVDYRRKEKSSKQTKGGSWRGLVDDGPAIAEILQEGFKVCQRQPPADFLRTLGAKNAIYEAPGRMAQLLSSTKSGGPPSEPRMRIEAVPPHQRLQLLPEDAVREMIGRYEGPENILSQTGKVQASSCETQPAQDLSSLSAWPYAQMGPAGYAPPSTRVMAPSYRPRIAQPLQASPSLAPAALASVASVLARPCAAVYPAAVQVPASPWAVQHRLLRPTVVA